MIKRLLSRSNDARQHEYWETDPGIRPVDHPIVAGFSRQRWSYLRRVLPLGSIASAVDVGAGNGFSTHYAPGAIAAVACDGSSRYLARHPGRKRVLCDARALPFPADSFDLSYCWELLHHVEEPWLVLAEMARVSRRWVALFEPNPLNPAQLAFALLDREHRWVLRYRRGYLIDQIERAGLRPVHIQSVGMIFPNRTPPWLFPALRALPFRLPFVGISLLAIAEKRPPGLATSASSSS